MSLTPEQRDARNELIVREYRIGYAMRVIAARHDIGFRQVGRIVKAAGAQKGPRHLPGRKPGRNKEMAECYLAGDTLEVIAQRYGVSAGTVWQILRRLDVRLSPEETKRRRSGRGRKRLPISDAERPHYEKLRWHFGAAYARREYGIAA